MGGSSTFCRTRTSNRAGYTSLILAKPKVLVKISSRRLVLAAYREQRGRPQLRRRHHISFIICDFGQNGSTATPSSATTPRHVGCRKPISVYAKGVGTDEGTFTTYSRLPRRLSAQQSCVMQWQFRYDRAETPAGSAKNNSHIQRASQQPKLEINMMTGPCFVRHGHAGHAGLAGMAGNCNAHYA